MLFDTNVAKALETNKTKNLLKTQKLILVLDLDHTLIHTVQGNHQYPGVEIYEIEGNKFSTKKRPYLERFLEKLQDLYEMCVYTMGSHKYAGQIVHIIDPKGIYFGNRVLSK